MHLLFTVADRFYIEGRGCVLVPGVSTDSSITGLRQGTRIRLRTPSGKEIDTFIKDLEMITHRQEEPAKIAAPVLLPKDIAKEDVPVGTEVLLLD